MLRCLLIISLLVPLLGACSAPRVPEGGRTEISGKVTVHRAGIPGVRVEAYPAATRSLEGPPSFRSAASAADGRFRLELPPGDYYLLARGEGQFAFYGRNPVTVPAGGLDQVNIGLVPVGDPPPSTAPFIETGVAGRVMTDGRSLAGAMVHLYTDLTDDLKGMGYAMTGPTGTDGYFEVAVPPGTYYLLARKRDGGASFGPLHGGDFIGYCPANPVRVKPGQVAATVLPMLEVPGKMPGRESRLPGGIRIRGRILDAEGDPVAGARAVLYSDPQMFNRPLYVSAPTGADGAYVLSFPHSGTYYLAARDTLGGAPGPGDLYGTWDGTADHSIVAPEAADLSGIDIVVEEMW